MAPSRATQRRVVVDLLARERIAARAGAAPRRGTSDPSPASAKTLKSTSRTSSAISTSSSGLRRSGRSDAVARDRFGIGHARERIGQLHAEHLLNTRRIIVLHDRHDRVLVEEGGLHVELGEFGLAVGAQVLVAETARDLIVSIQSRHHQQLLEELRRLRQREELSRMRAARHEIVARAFRRRLGQDRRLDVREALRVEVARSALHDAMAQLQPFAHDFAAQVDVAVTQAQLFARLLIELEGRRLRRIEHFDGVRFDLHASGGERGIDHAVRTRAHAARHLEHVLVAHALGRGESLRRVGIDDDLQSPRTSRRSMKITPP